MYAFGDVEKPDSDSIALMEDMTLSFLVDLCHRARPSPHKVPIPSNQNVINTIANAVLAEEAAAALEAAAANASTANSNSSKKKAQVSSSAARRDRTMTRGDAAADSLTTSSASSKRNYMPPRLVAHPYVARPRMTVEDLKFACRKDAKLSSRIEELLYLDKVITAAQKAFDNPEEDVAAEEAAS